MNEDQEMTNNTTTEFEAFQQVHKAIAGLDNDSRMRVLSAASTLFNISTPVAVNPSMPATVSEESSTAPDNEPQKKEFTVFAELYAAANPISSDEKALVAGYWLQTIQGADNFTGQSANKELTHLGHKLGNVTNALSRLIKKKPNLVLQLQKSGKSQQSRKIYKLSFEGNKRVKEMINAE